MKEKRPKHHHYISRFYLRRFADDDDQIAMYRRASGNRRMIGTKNAAVESDFYTVISEDGTPSAVVEKALGTFEQHAGAILRQIDNGIFPPSEQERHWLSAYIALMLTRTAEYRHIVDAFASFEVALIETLLPENMRSEIRHDDCQPDEDKIEITEAMRSYLAEIDAKPSKTVAVARALIFALDELAPVVAAMKWQLVTTECLAFGTSDHPVVYWCDPSSAVKLPSVGLETADEVYFPLGPRQLLVLTQSNTCRAPFQATGETIERVNGELIAATYEAIFSHPEHNLVGTIKIPNERPILHVNDVPIFRDGRGNDEASRRVQGSILRSGPRRSNFAIVSAGHSHSEMGPGRHGNPVVGDKYDQHVALLRSWSGRQSEDTVPFRVISGENVILFHFMRGDRYWSVAYARDTDTWEDHGEQSAAQV